MVSNNYRYFPLISWKLYMTTSKVYMSRDQLIQRVKHSDNLNYMAKFDSKEQDYQQLDYQVQRDRYPPFFGPLLIKYRHWYDTS